ncbi:MAG: phosphoribosylanthranilate isomerase [Lachnospiraceae bacterium]|nr:phosphoribosylanthranilate isomerase [Lachnospiraceae bacterium]
MRQLFCRENLPGNRKAEALFVDKLAEQGKDGSGMICIKMCGLRRSEDVLAVNRCRPDLAGFILSPGFGRSITREQMQVLKPLLHPTIRAVGVFVDEPLEHVAALLREGLIDIAQLHGQEDDAYIARLRSEIEGKTTDCRKEDFGELGKRQEEGGFEASAEVSAGAVTGVDPENHSLKRARIIKAFKIREKADLERAERSGADLVLLDSGTGTGKTFDWSLVEGFERPFLLAGGLDPENVAEAIRQVKPFGVDVSSGIETDRVKDPEKMESFVRQVRRPESR